MKITRVTIINLEEKIGFTTEFDERVNYVFSHAENNKGKTILLNSIGTLFGKGIFPDGFDARDHVIIVEVALNSGEKYSSILRDGSNWEIHIGNKIKMCSSELELSAIWDEYVFKLPIIQTKFNNFPSVMYLDLLSELIMGYQDYTAINKINASDNYKNSAYINAISQLKHGVINMDIKVKELKQQEKEYKVELKELNQISELMKNAKMDDISDKYNLGIENVEHKIKSINEEISECEKLIRKEISRKDKLLTLLKSIRTPKDYYFSCKKCGSKEYTIYYKEVKFDLLNDIQIKKLHAIIDEDIEEKDLKINNLITQKEIHIKKLNNLIESNSLETTHLLIYLSNKNGIDKYKKIKNNLALVQKEIKNNEKKIQEKSTESEIISLMEKINSKNNFDHTLTDLKIHYSKKSLKSGSTGINFLHIRTLAVNEYLSEYNLPMVFDNFRGQEIASPTEKKYINYFLNSNNSQVIVSATHKEGENIKKAKNIDYLELQSNTLLTPNMYDNCMRILNEVSLEVIE